MQQIDKDLKLHSSRSAENLTKSTIECLLIAKEVHELADMYKDIQEMVHVQGADIDQIVDHVDTVAANVTSGNSYLVVAEEYTGSYRRKVYVTLGIVTGIVLGFSFS